MKQLAIISGKGGTGKTVISGSLVALAQEDKPVIADCDVDAPDLHLILRPEIDVIKKFKGLAKANIDEDKCTQCGRCREVCRFDAVTEDFQIDDISCEGCKFCFFVCPVNAVELLDNIAGRYYISQTKYGPMVHAQLGVAEENSGKLTTNVRNEAKSIAEQRGNRFVIIDGPPGIGCPAIASISGVDMTVVVTEPTITAISDLKRVLSLSRHFGIKTVAIINKFDIDRDNSNKIEDWCKKEGVGVLGKIPFDAIVPKSIVARKPLVEYKTDGIVKILNSIFARIKELL